MSTYRLSGIAASGLLSLALLAQVPQAISYQAVLRDPVSGTPLSGATATGRYLLHADVPTGTVVYEETHAISANDQGLFTLRIGGGTPVSGSFSTIDWGGGPYFLETQLDVGNTGSFTAMGTQELLSVPYALRAGKSSNVPDGTEVGQIMHWDGNTWVADSGLYVYQKRFGVGVKQPDGPLGILADPAGTFCVSYLDEGSPKWKCEDRQMAGGPGGLNLIDATANGGNGASRLFVQDSTGHIGIGTNQPPSPFAIVHRNILKTFFASGATPNQQKRGMGIRVDSTGFGFSEGHIDSLRSRLFVQSGTGHVGIGTNDPPAALSIGSRETLKTYFQTGDIPTQDDFAFLADSSGFSIDQGTPSAHTNRFFIDAATGNVGVGTTTPTEKYFIHAVHHGGRTGMGLRNGAIAAQAGWIIAHLDDPAPERAGAFALLEKDDVADSERITVRPGGNVGINEQMPYATLHVTRPVADPSQSVSLSENTGIVMVGPVEQHLVMDSQSIQARHLLAGATSMVGSGGQLRLQPLGGDLIVHESSTNADSKFVIKDNGNVGIGTDEPPAPFSLKTRNILKTYFQNGDVPTQSDFALHISDTTGFSIEQGTPSSSTSRLFIAEGTGKVGVGTLTPAEKLHVNGAVVLGNSSSTTPVAGTIRFNGTDFEGRTASGDWAIFNGTIWQRGFASNSVHHNGRVGIGVDEPAASLHVDQHGAEEAPAPGAFVSLIDSYANLIDDRNLIGLRVQTVGSASAAGFSKNVGLYVSDVSGQAAHENNLAAVLNGNVVIGDLRAQAKEVGANGTNVLAIQNGGAPSAPPSTSSGLPDAGVQLYSASGADGVSTLHLMNGDGSVVQLRAQNALSAPDLTPVNPVYDPATAALIENMRTRINELENRLLSLGLLKP